MQVLLLYPELVPDRYHSAVLYDAALEDVAAGRVVNDVALADPTPWPSSPANGEPGVQIDARASSGTPGSLGSSLSIDPGPAPS